MARVESDIAVEVVYALPERQSLVTLMVPQGTTVREAITLSGLPQQYPAIDATLNAANGQGMTGIFGKRVPPDTVLKGGDRVEIYRPLTADPKEARRRRARKAR